MQTKYRHSDTLHSFLGDERINVSRHELFHGTLAHLCGYYVEGIELRADQGRTIIEYPVAPSTFAAAYAESLFTAALGLVRILAVIRIGSYGELHAGMFGAAMTGQDLADTEAWRTAVLPIYGHDGWTRVMTESLRGMTAWYRHDAVQRCVSVMAPVLAQHPTMSRYQLLTMFADAGVGLLPDPYWTAIIAPARYTPGTPARTTAPSGSVDHRLVHETAGARYSPEDDGWRWSDAAQHGHGGWIK